MRKIYNMLDQIFNKFTTCRRSDLKNDHKLIYSLGNNPHTCSLYTKKFIFRGFRYSLITESHSSRTSFFSSIFWLEDWPPQVETWGHCFMVTETHHLALKKNILIARHCSKLKRPNAKAEQQQEIQVVHKTIDKNLSTSVDWLFSGPKNFFHFRKGT